MGREASSEISTSDSILDNEDNEYVVEEIIDRRLRKGHLEYFVKWQDFPDEDNTWELSKHLDCATLIADFEHKRFLNNNKRQAELKINELYEAKAKKLKIEASVIIDNAFDSGYKALAILSASDKLGKLSFLIQFKHLEQPERVSSDVAYAQIPQMVIKFFEKQLRILNAFSTSQSK